MSSLLMTSLTDRWVKQIVSPTYGCIFATSKRRFDKQDEESSEKLLFVLIVLIPFPTTTTATTTTAATGRQEERAKHRIICEDLFLLKTSDSSFSASLSICTVHGSWEGRAQRDELAICLSTDFRCGKPFFG